jgi:acyl carrier protein
VTEQEVLDRLTPLFRDVFQDNGITVRSDTTAADVKRWDSLTHIDMIMLVEENFGIRVPTRDVTRMKNVGDLVQVIRARAKVTGG